MASVSNVAPVSNILDFIVDAADSDESTADAKKKSRKAISFPHLVPRHGSKPVHVHVNTIVARFYHFLQQELYTYAQQSADRLKRVRSTLMRNDPLPADSIHEFSFVAIRFEGRVDLARIMGSLRREGGRSKGPRSLAWPLGPHAEKCSASFILFKLISPSVRGDEVRLSLCSCQDNQDPARIARILEFFFTVIIYIMIFLFMHQFNLSR